MKIATSKSFEKKIRKQDVIKLMKAVVAFCTGEVLGTVRVELQNASYNHEKKTLHFKMIRNVGYKRIYEQCTLDLNNGDLTIEFQKIIVKS